MDIPLKTESNIDEAVEQINNCIHQAAWNSTPEPRAYEHEVEYPTHIRNKIKEKRKLRKIWQTTRWPEHKAQLNKVTKTLKKLLHDIKNQSVQDYLEKLTPTEATDYSLWKATKKLKQPQRHIPPIQTESGTWARSSKEKAIVFGEHLASVYCIIYILTNVLVCRRANRIFFGGGKYVFWFPNK